MSSEVSTLSRLRIRNTRPRWARIVQQMIGDKKKSEGKEKPSASGEGEAVLSDADYLEEKALKEKENVEYKSKQKVGLLSLIHVTVGPQTTTHAFLSLLHHCLLGT